MEVIWSELAEKDLDAIISYIANDNIEAALEIDELLRREANNLGTFPKKGKPGRIPGTRELVVHPSYLLVYLIKKEQTHIITVLHSSRQWPPA